MGRLLNFNWEIGRLLGIQIDEPMLILEHLKSIRTSLSEFKEEKAKLQKELEMLYRGF